MSLPHPSVDQIDLANVLAVLGDQTRLAVVGYLARNEGTPVALIEAMASAVPGVSTDVGGVKDVIHNTSVGRLAPFGDAGALAAAILDLLGDDEARRATGAAARAHVLARYSLDRLVNDIDALYRRVTGPE